MRLAYCVTLCGMKLSKDLNQVFSLCLLQTAAVKENDVVCWSQLAAASRDSRRTLPVVTAAPAVAGCVRAELQAVARSQCAQTR